MEQKKDEKLYTELSTTQLTAHCTDVVASLFPIQPLPAVTATLIENCWYFQLDPKDKNLIIHKTEWNELQQVSLSSIDQQALGLPALQHPLTIEQLEQTIRPHLLQILTFCQKECDLKMPYVCGKDGGFLLIDPYSHPDSQKINPLKDQFKSVVELDSKVERQWVLKESLITYNTLKKRMQLAENKIAANGLFGRKYDKDMASIKLHISVNNFNTLTQDAVLNIITMLTKEALLLGTDVLKLFKIIRPEPLKAADPSNPPDDKNRFLQTDQLTIYFDEYAPIRTIFLLAEKLNQFLVSEGYVNTQSLGEKDCFGVNDFVSARFDNNKLLGQYGVYHFFDLELKKFFTAHPGQEAIFDTVPLCALEAVFNRILTSPVINV